MQPMLWVDSSESPIPIRNWDLADSKFTVQSANHFGRSYSQLVAVSRSLLEGEVVPEKRGQCECKRMYVNVRERK
jgi:hypothetical protein